MRPFQQFRLWLRAGPVAERTVTAVATLLVLALAVWAAVPTGGGASDDGLAVGPGTSTTGGDTGTAGTGAAAGTATGVVPGTTGSSGVVSGAAGTTGASGASGTAGGPGGPVTSTGSSGAGTTSGTGGPTTQCPGAVAGQGVSATEIRVGVVIVTIGELNPAIGIPSEADHQRAYEAIFADYNKRGGAVCRKLVPRFYVTNPINAETERAACLQMQQDKVFAVINNLFNPQNVTCVAQAKIPNFWYTTPHTPEIRKYHPYILSFQSDYDRLIETYVRGAKTVGWFAGVQKIGILDQSCFPDLSAKIRTELRGAGYPDSQWSVFNYGCTQAISEPEKDTQAAIQFQRDQVTHVMSVEYLGSQNFARAAQQQGYRPSTP